MTPLQKQALFTLRQALVMCETAGIVVIADAGSAYLEKVEKVFNPWRLTALEIEEFEKELGE